MIPNWVSKYIGIPFVSRGRDFSGVDCYGVIYLVLDQEFGKRLPLYDGSYEDAFDSHTVSRLIDAELPLIGGRLVEVPVVGDVAVVFSRGKHGHLGLYVGDGLLLHARDRRNGSLLERLDSPSLASKIAEYWHVL